MGEGFHTEKQACNFKNDIYRDFVGYKVHKTTGMQES